MIGRCVLYALTRHGIRCSCSLPKNYTRIIYRMRSVSVREFGSYNDKIAGRGTRLIQDAHRQEIL